MHGSSHSGKSCLRCGTCCIKGGPALHQEDLKLLTNGVITARDLYTLRVGEPVNDQVLGKVTLLDVECVKIRSIPESSECIFHRSGTSRCWVYADRPLECQALKCWDTTELCAASRRPRLTRFESPEMPPWQAELVLEHEKRCSAVMLMQLLRENTPCSRQRLHEARAYDSALRDVLVEHGLEAGRMDFLLGRPLDVVLHGLFGYMRMVR